MTKTKNYNIIKAEKEKERFEKWVKFVMDDIKYLEKQGWDAGEILDSDWEGYVYNRIENEKIVKEAFARCGYTIE